MASYCSRKLLLLRIPLCRALKFNSSSIIQRSFLSTFTHKSVLEPSGSHTSPLKEGPAAIDYRSLLQEDEYHRLANATIHDLLDKLEELILLKYMRHRTLRKDELLAVTGEAISLCSGATILKEYGDSVDIDSFDVDYGNEVLTLKLGSLGTYVINKQTPNRQIWMSSPVSGPSRFDWDQNSQGWVYRRTKANLVKVLEDELEKLCGSAIDLS